MHPRKLFQNLCKIISKIYNFRESTVILHAELLIYRGLHHNRELGILSYIEEHRIIIISQRKHSCSPMHPFLLSHSWNVAYLTSLSYKCLKFEHDFSLRSFVLKYLMMMVSGDGQLLSIVASQSNFYWFTSFFRRSHVYLGWLQTAAAA